MQREDLCTILWGDKPHTAAKCRKHVSCPPFSSFDSMLAR